MEGFESCPSAGRPWFEPASILLMTAATLATAWCSFQSEGWSEHAGDLSKEADHLMRESLALTITSQQVENLQAQVFAKLVEAKITGNTRLRDFYVRGVARALKPTYEKWLALKPFENPAAPPHPPFFPGLYTSRPLIS